MAELSQMKQQQRAMWAMGDYPSIAERIATAGATAVEAGVVGQGDVVLDVACGTGNATIPAARTGAKVTGLDLTQLLEGRRRSRGRRGRYRMGRRGRGAAVLRRREL